MISDGLSKNQSEILLPRLLSTLDGMVVNNLKDEIVKGISWEDCLEVLDSMTDEEVTLQKTLTGVPYVLLKNHQAVLLRFLYSYIEVFNSDISIAADIREYNKCFPFKGNLNQCLFVGTSKKLYELSDTEIKMYASQSRTVVENMLFEYALLVLSIDRVNETSVFRDYFTNIVLFCNSNVSKKYCFREAVKLLMLSSCHKWFIPGLFDMRKQKVNFNYADLIGRLIIDNEELFPRIPYKASLCEFKYDNGKVSEEQPKAIRLLKIMEESTKNLLEGSNKQFSNVSEIIDFVLSTDLLPKDEYLTKSKYELSKIIMSDDIKEGVKRLNSKTMRYE